MLAPRPLGRIKLADAAQTYTMSMRSQLVVEAVVVKDKQGKPIEGLTAKDFTLTEDGVASEDSLLRASNPALRAPSDRSHAFG